MAVRPTLASPSPWSSAAECRDRRHQHLILPGEHDTAAQEQLVAVRAGYLTPLAVELQAVDSEANAVMIGALRRRS
jgi:hypothetical protein